MRNYLIFIACLVTSLATTGLAEAESNKDKEIPQKDMDVARQVLKRFFAAPNALERIAEVERIYKANPNVNAIERCLRIGRTYPDNTTRGWLSLKNQCMDGEKRLYQLYVPENYKSTEKYPLFVFLHGGVSRPNVPTPEETKGLRQAFENLAKKRKCLVLLPGAQNGATWWDPTGFENVLAQLDYVKCHYNIDEDRVLLWGISDGAGGACWMAMHRPTVWAGFLAYAPNLGVTNLGPYPCYPRNLLNRPILAANDGRDGMGPGFNSRFARHWFEQLRQLGVPVDWKESPETGHCGCTSLDKERRNKFLDITVRNPRPARVVWETADLEANRCDWVCIDEIKNVNDNDADLKDVNLTPSGPLSLGLEFDKDFSGPGILITEVTPNSAADMGGLSAGDVLITLEGASLAKNPEQVIKDKIWPKNPGDKITGEYQRKGKTQQFNAKMPKEAGQPLYPRSELAGAIDAKAEGNCITVRARNVSRYTLFIDRNQFDLAQPIRVLTNGRESFHAKVIPNLAFMLSQASEDNDRHTVYCAKIEIVLFPRETKKNSSNAD